MDHSHHFKNGRGRLLWLVTAGLATACFFCLAAQPLHAAEAPRLKTESPYFAVGGQDGTVDRLPLKATEVDVRITGVIADVTVVQHYRNEGQGPIEAQYVFPGSTRAAVGGLTVRLGQRLITAEIREKQQARIEYDTARQQGRTAALLEQHRPNVFQMKVANILPGDDVRVELRYSELLVPQDGRYEFVFPTVVGPRYDSPSGAPSKGPTGWVSQPTLHAGEAPNGSFALRVSVDAPVGIRELASRTHGIVVQQDGVETRHADIVLAADGKPAHNRDFVLDYRLAGDRIDAGVMLFRGQGPGAENFFLAMVEPPKAVPASAIVPREYIFVVDVSGSMHGFPLDTAKAMLTRLIGGLRPSDRFNVMLFSGSARMLSPQSVPATRANVEQALATIDGTQGGGGTELIPALQKVYAQPKPEGVSRTVVVVTDGYVTVEREAFALVRSHLSQANLFSFGIGSSVNRELMEGLARAGMGEAFVITDPVQAPEQAARFRRMVEQPVLTDVKASFKGLDVYDVEPASLPDVMAERPVLLFGKFRGEARGSLVIEGRGAEGPWRREIAVDDSAARPQAVALRSLWARHRIASLSDQESLEGGDSFQRRITELGLQYSLLTQYTSFIAVDQVVRNPVPSAGTTVVQPQPLPQGVGDSAVAAVIGAEVPTTPEPAAWGAALVVLSVLVMLQRRARRHDSRRFTA